MARRNQHSLAEIKTLVLDAAEAIVAEEGFSALTIRKIAVEMGYTVGSIYMVFENRADLIRHLNARTLADMVAQLLPLSQNADIETWLTAYLHYAHRHSERWRMIFMPHSPEDTLPDWYQAELNNLFQQFAAYFDKQDTLATTALWQGIQGICLLSAVDDTEAQVLTLFRLCLSGLHTEQM